MTNSAMLRIVFITMMVAVSLMAFANGSMTASKLSIHTSMLTQNSWNVIDQGMPRIVKLLDTFSPAAAIKQSNPGIIIIGRIYLSNQPQSGDPNATAAQWWSDNHATIQAYPDVDYWEGYNEPSVPDVDSITWYAQFDAARVEILAQNGLKAVIGSFATGTPDVTNSAIIQAYYPAIDAAMKHGGILGLHEYSAPYLNSSYSGSPQSGSGWLTGRYRMLYNQFLIPSNRQISLAITENGIDGGTCSVTGCDISGGWQNFCSYWNAADCNKYYLDQLHWYDQVLQADSYVLGSTIFCLDIYGWGDFDITPMVPDFIAYLQQQQ